MDSTVMPRKLKTRPAGTFMKITRLASQIAASAARSIMTDESFGKSTSCWCC